MLERLDDNTQEGLKFLVLGAGAVLVVRVVLWGAASALAPDDGASELSIALAGSRHGFLLTDQRILVGMTSGLAGRLGFSALIALVGTLVAASAAAALAGPMRWGRLRTAVITSRSVLVVLMAWCVQAALFMPPRYARVEQDALVLVQRPALLDMISLPWPAEETTIRRSAITDLSTRSIASSMPGCGSTEVLEVSALNTIHTLVSRTPTGPDCAESIGRERASLEHLAILLERWRLDPAP